MRTVISLEALRSKILDKLQHHAAYDHQCISHLQMAVIDGMSTEEAAKVRDAADQIHAAVNLKFLRKEKEINNTDTEEDLRKVGWVI